MTIKELREEWENKTGIKRKNTQLEIDIEYVWYIEDELLKHINK